MATVALLLQFVFLYTFTGINKLGSWFWQEGYALSINLIGGFYNNWLGHLLLKHTYLIDPLHMPIIWFEILAPLLMFLPIFTKQIRTILVISFLVLQLFFLSTFTLHFFPIVSTLALLAFFPSGTWDYLERLGSKIKFPTAFFQKITERFPPKREHFRSLKPLRHLLTVFISFLLIASIVSGAAFAAFLRNPDSKLTRNLSQEIFEKPLYFFGLATRWVMFVGAPTSKKWFILRGELRDGSEIDFLQGAKPVNWEKPDRLDRTVKNERWRIYMNKIGMYGGYRNNLETHQALLARHLCREWNADHQGLKALDSVQIISMEEPIIEARAETIGKPSKVILFDKPCGHVDGIVKNRIKTIENFYESAEKRGYRI